MSLGDRIRQARLNSDKSQQDIADIFGITREAVNQWEDGSTSPRHKRLLVLADALKVDLNWLITGVGLPTNPKNANLVKVVGYVGGGQAVHAMDDLGAGLEEVERPVGVEELDIVAVRIRGNSMFPLKDGWLLYYRRTQDGVPDECRNKLCVCKTIDGRTYVKEVQWTKKRGHFNLIAYNDVPIEDVALDWAAPVLSIKPT